MTAAVTETPAFMTPAEALGITTNLLRQHGLKGWLVQFDNAKRRAGQCNYRLRVISLSKHLMARRSYRDTMNTITHEIAHALTPGQGHGYRWVRQHQALGGDGKRCFQSDDVDLSAPWIATCGHGKQFARYRRPKRLEGYRCRCSQGSTPVVWTNNR
ncbi:SprT-like protease [Mycobacterium phage DroogsArmy]|uniref:SprT-like protease n=1 Tax=Mycobacterium phage DroogsArmy TaxID=2744011 RepID=A0A6N0A5Q5_9CAUD|nr:SprT-like protease [Mycobacterium phage DroogsArmy]QKO02473.1 SprT-like protease [Mycobacterium phage DroogsArmy]